jgi:hypothetical protein
VAPPVDFNTVCFLYVLVAIFCLVFELTKSDLVSREFFCPPPCTFVTAHFGRMPRFVELVWYCDGWNRRK